MTKSTYGKILIVDDQMNIPVKDLIVHLIESGFHVQYWNAEGNFYKHITNVRVLILDLDFTGGLFPTQELELDRAVNVLGKIQGPYMVMIYSETFAKSDIDKIKLKFEREFNKPFEGYIEGIEGLSKSAGPKELVKRITTMIREKEVYKLILTWEQLLDRSKDEGLAKFVEQTFENEVRQFVKFISDDLQPESVPREFISNMLRFVSRYMLRGENYRNLAKILMQFNDGSVNKTSDRFLQHRHMYFKPARAENIWTGDIFKINGGDKYWNYGIILTPECDVAHAKNNNYLMCKGFAIDRQRIKKAAYPICSITNDLNALNKPNMSENKYQEKLNNILNSREKHPRYYLIWNFLERKKYIGLCFDFQNINSFNKNYFLDNSKPKRIVRLDVPYVTELIQKYSAYSTRLGIPSINHPHTDPPNESIFTDKT